MMLATISVVAWIAVVCGLSFVVILAIIVSPWPRLDHEPRRLDDDVETRLLLHEDPEELADELDAEEDAPSSVADIRRDERA